MQEYTVQELLFNTFHAYMIRQNNIACIVIFLLVCLICTISISTYGSHMHDLMSIYKAKTPSL